MDVVWHNTFIDIWHNTPSDVAQHIIDIVTQYILVLCDKVSHHHASTNQVDIKLWSCIPLSSKKTMRFVYMCVTINKGDIMLWLYVMSPTIS